MNPSVAASSCPRCGTALPADAPEGLCPRCLLRLNLAGALGEGREGEGGEGGRPGRGAPPMAPEEMARHFPQLEILECLGRGGMGVVYKARQPRLGRLVALKVLAPGRETEPQFAERFTREAQALARLAHPAIVAVHDFGEADGHFYLLMEYVDGVSLRTLLRDGKVRPEEALAIVPRICEALQFAHDQGVVHRDIKPENILLDRQGRVKIADFGIAKLVGGAGGSEPLTGEWGVVGTPHYMAPEQVEHPRTVDHRADIYSLGVVFYELLTGELPLGRFAAPSRKATIDRRLDAVVLRSLEKEPDRRYQQAGEVKTELETIAAQPASGPADSVGPAGPSAVIPPPAPPSEVGPVSCLRSLRAVAVGLLLVAGLNLMAVGMLVGAAAGLVLLDRRGVDLDGPLPEVVAWLQSRDPSSAKTALGACVLLVMGGSGLMTAGALRLRRLESYRLALVAGALAMVLPPGNLLGVPIGLWALLVLGRRVTQQAFRDRLPHVLSRPLRARSGALVSLGAMGLLLLGLVGLRFWMESAPPGGDRRRAALREEVERKAQVDAARAAAARENLRSPGKSEEAGVGSSASSSTVSVPPVVVSTFPMSGATDVDPALTEVRVTFSKPMLAGGWSWSTWLPGTEPEIVGEPRYLADGRTCVVGVRLAPGRTYGFWLNSARFANFQDAEGRPAIPYLLVFATRGTSPP